MIKLRKLNLYRDTFAKMYFWRTKQQQEVDYIEELNGQISGYEIKWANKEIRFPKTFIEAYQAKGFVVNRSNFRDFLKLKN
jgi:hypothetical protein